MHRSSLLVLAALLPAAPLAAQNLAGYRYALRMTSSDGEDVVGTVRLAGDRERIDFPPGARHDDGYVLLLNRGHTGVTASWVSPDLRLPPNPLLELLATVETALAQRNEDFVHRSAAARAALFSGTPLKMVITSRSFDVDRGDSGRVAAGEHAVRTFEVTRVERASFDTSLFRIPEGFTRKDNPLSFKLF